MPPQPDEPKHSPTPWNITRNDTEANGVSGIYSDKTLDGVLGPYVILDPGTGYLRVELHNDWQDEPMLKRDIAFLLRAVNCHEELLAMCKKSLDWLDTIDYPERWTAEVREELRGMIAKATAPFSEVAPI